MGEIAGPVVAANAALLRVLVAALLGGLIGVERERAAADGGRHFAGVRTFPIIALVGAGLTLAAGSVGAVVAAGFLGVAALVLLAYVRSSRDGDVGATTEVAALATYVVGVLAGAGALLVAGAIGIGVAVLLAAKQRLEAFPRALSDRELGAALTLAVIAAVILPVLPDASYGPWGVWNPRTLWGMVVLVCGLSFVAFVAMRLWGSARGLYLSGLLGGLVSSTAATVSFAGRSREAPGRAAPLAVAAGLACLVMLVRIGILAGVANPGLLVTVAPFLGLSLAGGALALIALARRAPADEATAPEVTNPFRLAEAIKFAAVYALVLLLVAAANRFLGAWGLVAAALIAGLTDVDAITLSLAAAAGTTVEPALAAAAVAVAALSNTVAKAVYAAWLGAPAFRRPMLAVLGAAFAAGGAALAAGVLGVL
jgi:uncharacterized membrane protein (DUF4010 family)